MAERLRRSGPGSFTDIPVRRKRGERPPLEPPPDGSPAQRTALGVGFVLLLAGLFGFFSPGFMGAHSTPPANAFHLAAGLVAIWFGLSATPRSAEYFCLAFGVALAGIALLGFLAGSPGYPSVADFAVDRYLFVPLPGRIELGTHDHIFHFVAGAACLASSLASHEAIFEPRREERHRAA